MPVVNAKKVTLTNFWLQHQTSSIRCLLPHFARLALPRINIILTLRAEMEKIMNKLRPNMTTVINK